MSSELPPFDYCVLAHWVSLGWLYALHPRYRSIVGYTILSGATHYTVHAKKGAKQHRRDLPFPFRYSCSVGKRTVIMN